MIARVPEREKKEMMQAWYLFICLHNFNKSSSRVGLGGGDGFGLKKLHQAWQKIIEFDNSCVWFALNSLKIERKRFFCIQHTNPCRFPFVCEFWCFIDNFTVHRDICGCVGVCVCNALANVCLWSFWSFHTHTSHGALIELNSNGKYIFITATISVGAACVR